MIERCRPWIAAALEYSRGTHTVEDVEHGILSGRFHLWPAARGCLVTEFIEYPQKRVLNVFLGGGELDQLTDMHDAVEAFARAAGCKAVLIQGRRGWARVWRDQGFKPVATVLEKEI